MAFKFTLSPELAGAALIILIAGWAGGAACVPTPFTFQETPGQGGGSPTSSSAGGAGGATSSTADASSSSGVTVMCEAGTECASAPPGWDGFFQLTHLDYPFADDMVPTCPDGQPAARYLFDTHPSWCTGCPCTAVGGSCTTGVVECFTNNVCTVPAQWTVENTTSTCISFDMVPMQGGADGGCVVKLEPTLMMEGVCTPGTSTLIFDAPWKEAIFACPVPPDSSGACAPGETCAPTAPDVDSLCVLQDKHGKCPDGFNTNEYEVFLDGKDERGCEACACEGTKCATDRFELFDGTDCQDGSEKPIHIDSNLCMDLPGYFDGETASMKTLPPATDGVCSGGNGTGEVVTSGPMKFCCK